MIEWRFTPDDVARIRFAFSPLCEVVLSLIVLRDPAQHALHLPWVRSARSQVADVDLAEVLALVPARGIIADFLSPPPTSPLPSFDDEIDRVRHTSAAQVVADIVDVPGVPGMIADRIREDPVAAANRMADTLQEYWESAFAPIWPKVQALLEADVLWRARRLASGGATALFAELHESVVWHGDRLSAADPWDHSGALTGEGLLLVPSAMAWPAVRKMVAPYQPMIVYPVRGVATLWETGPPPSPQALASLVGQTRGLLLTALGDPGSTTTALADRLGLTPGAISQHLSILLANGLVTRSRVGGSVLYRRSAKGDLLVRPT